MPEALQYEGIIEYPVGIVGTQLTLKTWSVIYWNKLKSIKYLFIRILKFVARTFGKSNFYFAKLGNPPLHWLPQIFHEVVDVEA